VSSAANSRVQGTNQRFCESGRKISKTVPSAPVSTSSSRPP